jgi:phytoene dehydrogenase-like protein
MHNPDVVVIGGGIGGLVSAGLLAREGMRVHLLEKESKVGGYVTGFWREGFYFDATCAFVSACSPGDELHTILKELGISDELTFLPIADVWNIYPDFDLRINYQNPMAYLEEVKKHFPEYSMALESYSALTIRLGSEFLDFEQSSWWRRIFLPFFFPTLFRYVRKSHAEIFRKFFDGNPGITLALSNLPTTLPPSALSYAFVAVLWAKVLGGGVFYPKGGMLTLSEKLAKGVRAHGGQITCNQEVTRILTKGRKATGVELSNGEEIHAKWVIADINPFQGKRLLPDNLRLYGSMHRLEKYRPSLSALLFYVALPAESLPPRWPYFTSVHTTSDLEAMSNSLEAGSMEQGLHLVITIPTLMDSSLAPSGCHSLKIIVHAPRADLFEKYYQSSKALDQLQDKVFSAVHSYTGLDIKAHALFVERATPSTLFSRTGNEGGAMYGLDAACGQVGPQRPPNRTALNNLMWVGHYTHPAHGIVGCGMSGWFASKIILSRGSN